MLMMPAMGRFNWQPCWSRPQLMLMMPVSCFIDLWYLWSLLQLMLMTSAMGRIYWLPCWSLCIYWLPSCGEFSMLLWWSRPLMLALELPWSKPLPDLKPESRAGRLLRLPRRLRVGTCRPCLCQ